MSVPEEFLSVVEPNLGWAFGCSRTGASHRKNGRPCEDAFAVWSGSSGGNPCIAAAIADGHGDPRHDRSGTGAALAVSTAVEELIAFHRAHLLSENGPSIRSEFKVDFPRRASRRWRDAVREDMDRSGEARTSPDPATLPFSRYGSTLIAALIESDSILCGQIGDGDIILVRPDGTIEIPIPADTSLLGTETRSLSSRDAHLLWRTATLDRGHGGVLIAATDGVSDSFDGSEGPEFIRFVRSLVSRIHEYGIENVAGSMNEWLDRYSALASGDDMTIVFICINATSTASDTIGGDPEISPTNLWGP